MRWTNLVNLNWPKPLRVSLGGTTLARKFSGPPILEAHSTSGMEELYTQDQIVWPKDKIWVTEGDRMVGPWVFQFTGQRQITFVGGWAGVNFNNHWGQNYRGKKKGLK